MDLKQDILQDLEPRLRKIGVVMLILMGIILCRLYYLQGIRGGFYRLFSDENSIREVKIPAARGTLKDRHGVVVADNRAAFDLVLIPQYVVDPKRVFATLESDLHIARETLQKKWELRSRQPAFQPIVIWEDVPMDVVSWVKARQSPWPDGSLDYDLRGVEIHFRYEREYPQGDIASHLLGYLSEINPAQLKEFQKQWPGRYRKGDTIGVRGVESVWDIPLRGEDGYTQKVVNAAGREVIVAGLEDDLDSKTMVPGRELHLTIDARLQAKVRDYFRGKRGAVVALDPRDGAILTLFSAPTYDLNELHSPGKTKLWQFLATSPDHYLYNRTIQGAYPPGSVYKIVTSIAGFEEGLIKPHQGAHCSGAYQFGNRAFHCWKDVGHGEVEFPRSLIVSCDVFYYRLGQKLGVDRLAQYARKLGLGERTGIALPGEKTGLVPTREWKQRVYRQEWSEGENLMVAIGQGANLMTPLQAATMVATVANGGKKIKPHLLAEDWSRPEETGLNPDILASVRRALLDVVASPEGTAHGLSRFGIPIGGKTGTAQVVSKDRLCHGADCQDHAWFVAFAPDKDPVIAVAVLVENGGHGSSAAAPLAGELIQIYLGGE